MVEPTWTGKRVRCTNAFGGTFETTAHSEPHLNDGQTFGHVKPWLVVKVHAPGCDEVVNWPAEDVELLPVPFDEGGDG